ncbi:RNase P/RNase MRP complex subunit [Tieghemiomyces parasiticus]|uniref:Ribonuclease P protein subunit n=1 Tax=Tieghemiomyces parasiticus TaxID=78921 RepID=A0A9W8A5Q8_9FUNG|nr:RNase P/RNase MRP complex subunit [Tieghemiomyces parasiticus]
MSKFFDVVQQAPYDPRVHGDNRPLTTDSFSAYLQGGELEAFLMQTVNARDHHELERRVKEQSLLLMNPHKSRNKDTKINRMELLRSQRRSKGQVTLNSRQKRQLGVYDIPKDSQKYHLFEPLHKLWTGYMNDVAKNISANLLVEKLLKADYHGCILTVVKSKCPSLVGATGIVVQETKGVFKLINRNDQLKSIPKVGTVFAFTFNNREYQLFGSQLSFASSERAVKKFKPKPTVDL